MIKSFLNEMMTPFSFSKPHITPQYLKREILAERELQMCTGRYVIVTPTAYIHMSFHFLILSLTQPLFSWRNLDFGLL